MTASVTTFQQQPDSTAAVAQSGTSLQSFITVMSGVIQKTCSWIKHHQHNTAASVEKLSRRSVIYADNGCSVVKVAGESGANWRSNNQCSAVAVAVNPN